MAANLFSLQGLRNLGPTLQAWRADCPAKLKHYRSLVPMAQEVRKPIFHLTSADGAIGSHSYAVQGAWSDFKTLAMAILDRIGLG